MSERRIVALAVEPGAHTTSQLELAPRMRARLAHLPDARLLGNMVKAVYARSGIVQRHFELSDAQLAEREDWYLAVNEACVSLGDRTLAALFAKAEIPAGSIDAFVCITSSHAGFPSLSRRLQAKHSLRADAPAWDLAGLGCAGPTQGLALADMLLATGAAKNVCVLAVDVMGTHGALRRHDRAPDMSEIVAHCLASDGAAALILSADPTVGGRLTYTRAALDSELWADALDQNDFTACPAQQPRLSVGPAIRNRIVDETESVFSALDAKDGLLMHPGGAALMDRVESAYPQRRASVALSREILRDNGNLGAPSLLWVLSRALETGLDLGEDLLLFALGPGIVTTALRLSETRVP